MTDNRPLTRINALIFGHSHVWAINRAVETHRNTVPADIAMKVLLCGTQKFPGTLLCQSSKGADYINPALVSALSDYPVKPDSSEQNILVSMVQGNYYNIVGMLYEGQPFDFVLPNQTSMPYNDQDAEIVPYDAIQALITNQLYELPTFYRKLKNLGYKKIIHVGVPPPHPSSDYIYNALNQDAKFVNKPIQISQPYVRLKLWMVQELLLKQLCQNEGVEYLSAPSQALDSNGFLNAAFAKDTVHGNQAYAELVHQQIIDLIQQKFR